MEQQEVISKIKNVAMKTLPPRSSLFLYGSRARGDAHAKQSLEAADYGVAYPFRELGWEIGEDLNPSLYTKKQWSSWSFLPYYKNVERDKIVLL